MEYDKYPSNSDKSREVEKKTDEKKRGIVVTNDVKVKKKFSELIFSEDAGTVGKYIVTEVLIPGAKELLWQMVTNTLSMGLFGKGADASHGKNSSSPMVYSSIYGTSNKQKAVEPVQKWGVYDYDKIIYQTRTDAILVLESMNDDIANGYVITVGDLYEKSGIVTDNPMTQKYGWTNVSDAVIIPVKNGFGITFPRPEPIK